MVPNVMEIRGVFQCTEQKCKKVTANVASPAYEQQYHFWLTPEATARLSAKALPSEKKNITLASSGWDLANIVSIMGHLLVF